MAVRFILLIVSHYTRMSLEPLVLVDTLEHHSYPLVREEWICLKTLMGPDYMVCYSLSLFPLRH